VDDSALNLLAIRTQLSKIAPNSSCDQALDGNEAIEFFQERMKVCQESNWLIKPYRIILIDYNMPHCDGPTAIFRIR
jgi:CheY-like chemotaxis protein